jgi:repressor LexA
MFRRTVLTLTSRQQAVLDFLEEHLSRTGIMPSTREIQQHFGFGSQTAAMNHLRALESKGKIRRLPGKARAVAISSALKRDRIVDVPIYGRIAAGMASLAEQQEEGFLSLTASAAGIAPSRQAFALRVRGDSMTGANIFDGDLVVLEFREPRSGDVVAALIDGETTLKRYVLKGAQPFLKAENPAYLDLIPARELIVQGVMVALVRKFRG